MFKNHNVKQNAFKTIHIYTKTLSFLSHKTYIMPISSESEVLTLNAGWKFIKYITCEDEIACANSASNDCTEGVFPVFNYKKPYKIERVDYSGTICHLQNRHLNMLVSGDHPLWVCEDGRGYYGFNYANDVLGKAAHFMKFGELAKDFPEHFNKSSCKQLISECTCMADFPSSSYSQIAFHAGYSIDTFIETTQIDIEMGSEFFNIYDDSSFYSIEKLHDIPMYNLSIQDVDLIYVQRHGRACWIGL